MNQTIFLFITFMFAELMLAPHSAAQETANRQTTAFVNVNVIPMDSERILENQTVIIHDGKIVRMDVADQIEIPNNAFEIDGNGQYLLPGLADMHVHIWHQEDLLLYVANGITTVRNMNGKPYHLEWRKKIANGELLGPTIYTSGPTIYDERLSIDKAKQLVIDQKNAGYDFIKIYHYLRDKEPFIELMKTAKEAGIPVAGHKPRGISFREMLDLGQSSLEHMLSYVYLIEKPDTPLRAALQQGKWSFRYHYSGTEVDESKIPPIAEAVRNAGLWNCPTLIAMDRWIPSGEAQAILAQPHFKYINRSRFTRTVDQYLTDSSSEIRAQGRKVRRMLVQHLHQAGAKLLLGTDAGGTYIEPGFSIHTELQNLVEAGLSPYEAIKTGTYNAAEFLNTLDKTGSIAIGKTANLILLKANPLENVANVKKQSGVMLRGQWLPEKKLIQMLKEQAAAY